MSRLPSSSPTVEDPKLDFAPEDIAFADLAFANLADLPTAYNYTATLVEMSDNFKQRLLEGYQQDPDYNRIIRVLDANNSLTDENRAAIPFIKDEKGLI